MNRAHRRAAAKRGTHTPTRTKNGNLAVVWQSNFGAAKTGYGTQTAQVTRRMHNDGHAVAIAANYGLEGCGLDWDGIWVYPKGLAPYSEDVLRAYSQDWSSRHTSKTLAVFTLYDAWVYTKNPSLREMERIYSWVPVDHQPCPPEVVEWCKRPNVTPIAMSRFGVAMLEAEGVECLYAPHAIERVFQPTPKIVTPEGSYDAREALIGVSDDAFVVMMNSANKGHAPVRKAFGEAMLAFSIFASTRPDAVLYMHAEERTGMGGIDLAALARACSIKPEQLRFVNQFAYRQGIPESTLAALYSAADVLLAPSRGEGFGIPVVEAQACGTRVIVSDWTAQPELIAEDSWKVGGQPEWDPLQGAWFFAPNVAEIVSALEAAYAAPRGVSETAVEFAKAYDADLVYAEHWRPILKQIGDDQSTTRRGVLPAVNAADIPKPKNPVLTIYVPTFQRAELAACLASIAPQLTPDVEVVVSDNDPKRSAEATVRTILGDAAKYDARASNIGGNANILRGFSQGSGDYVWIIGDDDTLLPGAIAETLRVIREERPDRIMHYTKASASRVVPGHSGDLASLIRRLDDPSYLIAATLITANVLRRKSVDQQLGYEKIDTNYGHVWATIGAKKIVVAEDAFLTVGANHPGHIDGWEAIYQDLLDVMAQRAGIERIPLADATKWNFINI